VRLLRVLGVVLLAAVVAAVVSTLVVVNRRVDQVGRGQLASNGQGGGSVGAVQRAEPSVVRVERGAAGRAPAGSSTPGEVQGGSGVVIDARGYVLTAEALVAGADALAVAVPGGRTVPARVVGSDAQDALTLLRIEPAGLHAIGLGGATVLDTGSGVVVLAAPPYLQAAVGAVASAHASTLIDDPSNPGRRRPLNDLLALDVSPREGQLGAPVLDAAGRLAGLVVAAGDRVYAVDMTQAQVQVQQLIDSGKSSYASLGFQYQQLSASEAADRDVPGGVRVVSVDARAQAQGLNVDDIVISANGTSLDPGHPLSRLLRGLPVKQSVALVARPMAGGSRKALSLEVQLVPS
jgi:S1-C subfamily serine protease